MTTTTIDLAKWTDPSNKCLGIQAWGSAIRQQIVIPPRSKVRVLVPRGVICSKGFLSGLLDGVSPRNVKVVRDADH